MTNLTLTQKYKLFQRLTGWSRDRIRANDKAVRDLLSDGGNGGGNEEPLNLQDQYTLKFKGNNFIDDNGHLKNSINIGDTFSVNDVFECSDDTLKIMMTLCLREFNHNNYKTQNPLILDIYPDGPMNFISFYTAQGTFGHFSLETDPYGDPMVNSDISLQVPTIYFGMFGKWNSDLNKNDFYPVITIYTQLFTDASLGPASNLVFSIESEDTLKLIATPN